MSLKRKTCAGKSGNILRLVKIGVFYVDELSDIKGYSDNFDPEEEFNMWAEVRMYNRVRGIPDIPTLWKDQLWKQKTLEKVAGKIK